MSTHCCTLERGALDQDAQAASPCQEPRRLWKRNPRRAPRRARTLRPVANRPPSPKEPGAPPSEAALSEQRVACPEAVPAPRNVHDVSWVLVVVTTISSMFWFGLEQTITADVQAAIIAQFHDIKKLLWVSVTMPHGLAMRFLSQSG
jgi:hypothetical protein